MAHICAECRMPVRPVNECICPDDEDELSMAGGEPAVAQHDPDSE